MKYAATIAAACTLLAGTALGAGPSEMDAAKACTMVENAAARLDCFDKIFPPAVTTTGDASSSSAPPPAPEPQPLENGTVGAWQVVTEKDVMSDKTKVTLVSRSTEQVPGRYSPNDYAQLLVQCRDNVTSLVIYFGGAYMTSSEYDSYGDVTYRVDDARAVTRGFDKSTSSEHLGLWSGGVSIPLIKQMMGGERFRIKATPYNENPIQLEFPINGLEQAIAPLRKACSW